MQGLLPRDLVKELAAMSLCIWIFHVERNSVSAVT